MSSKNLMKYPLIEHESIPFQTFAIMCFFIILVTQHNVNKRAYVVQKKQTVKPEHALDIMVLECSFFAFKNNCSVIGVVDFLGAKRSSKIIITNKLQNSERWLYAAQGIVVLVIFETAINAASMEKFFLKKKPKSCKARLSIEKFDAMKKVLIVMVAKC